MRIALLFKSFGPYHVARLRAARSKASILAIEFTDVDGEYDWDIPDEKRSSGIISLSTANDRLSDLTNHQGCKVGRSRQLFSTRALIASRTTNDRQKAKLVTELRKFAPDAVAVPGYSEPLCLAAASLCRDLNLPTILMSDSHDLDQKRNPLREVLKQRIFSLFNAAFVAGTPHVDYLVRLGFPRHKITTGYDVVDNRHFAANSLAAERTATFSPPENFFFCCSRFVEGKNLQFLIDAFLRYRQQAHARPWDLVIAGNGPLYATLLRHVQGLSLTQYVHLIGRKNYDELPRLYASAGAFVFPSLSETWGLVVNEAMAAGLPVLVSKAIGCQHDLVREGLNGHVFDPANTAQLASVMALVAHTADRNAMGEASRSIVRHWDLDRFASGLVGAAAIAAASRVKSRLRGAAAIAAALSYRA